MAVVNITNQNYQEEVLKADKTVLMDFWAQLVWPMPDAFTGCGCSGRGERRYKSSEG